jgi:hypothetical protein
VPQDAGPHALQSSILATHWVDELAATGVSVGQLLVHAEQTPLEHFSSGPQIPQTLPQVSGPQDLPSHVGVQPTH